MKQIAYREGYKYQLAVSYNATTRIRPPLQEVSTRFIRLTPKGKLFIREDYAWDGPSGPMKDTKSAMRGSLEHDAKYQLIRLGLIPPAMKAIADQEFREVLVIDGTLTIRAKVAYWVLEVFGKEATEARSEPPVLYAP